MDRSARRGALSDQFVVIKLSAIGVFMLLDRRPPLDRAGFPIPDPRRWPAEIRAWLRDLKGAADPWSVAIFDHGSYAALYLEDALAALALLDVDPSGWDVQDGFPVLTFDRARIDEYSERFVASGYRVRQFVPDWYEQPAEPRHLRAKAKVIDIAAGRSQEQLEKAR